MKRFLATGCLLALVGAGAAPGFAAPTPLEAADRAFAAGDFARASSGYAGVLAGHPDDVAANRGLGAVALYDNDLDRAQTLLQHAAGLAPNDARIGHLLRDLEVRRGKPGTYRVSVDGEAATVPFIATDPLPVLGVRVNDRRDALFFIDTGAPNAVLDPQFLKELGIAPVADHEGVFAGGKRAPVERAMISSLTVGGARIDNLPVSVLPTRSMALLEGKKIDGIIGTGFLQRFLATIDYAGGRLILRPRSASSAFERAARQRSAAIVPMWLVGDHFIFARGHINTGPTSLFNIDTGLAGGGISATAQALKEAGITPDTAHATQGMGGGGPITVIPFTASVTLGDTTVPDVAGIFTPEGTPYGIFPFEVAGTISHGFFRRHALTFDFDAMRLVLD